MPDLSDTSCSISSKQSSITFGWVSGASKISGSVAAIVNVVSLGLGRKPGECYAHMRALVGYRTFRELTVIRLVTGALVAKPTA
jgi:hypothetical protein